MEVDVADCFKVRQKETGWTSAYVLGQLETLDLFSHSIVLASGIRLSKQSFLDFLGFLGYCGPLNSKDVFLWGPVPREKREGNHSFCVSNNNSSY